MKTTWIVVADSGRARIFSVLGPDRQLWELENLVNPAARLDNKDLETEARGRFHGGAGRSIGHTAEPDTIPERHQAELFAGRIADILDRACNDHRFETLSVIADPAFLGLLRQKMGKQTRLHVKNEVAKDLSGLDARQISQHLALHEALR